MCDWILTRSRNTSRCGELDSDAVGLAFAQTVEMRIPRGALETPQRLFVVEQLRGRLRPARHERRLSPAIATFRPVCSYTIDVAGEQTRASVHLKAPYDPRAGRVKS